MEIENTGEDVRSRTDVCVGSAVTDHINNNNNNNNNDICWRSETDESESKRRKQNTEIDLKNKNENENIVHDSFAVDNIDIENTNNDLSVNESVMERRYNTNNDDVDIDSEDDESDIVLDVTQQEDSHDWNSFTENSNLGLNLNKISTRIKRNKKIISDEKYLNTSIKFGNNTSSTIKKAKSEGVSTTSLSGIVRARSGLRSSETR